MPLAQLPCFLASQADRSRPYLVLSLNGSGVYPRIVFDADEILMPSVPLNVTSRALFHVTNDGYDNLDLTYKLPINCQVPLTVEFPKGQSIGLGTDKIPVIVSFQSEKAISLHTKIDFFDADGSCYSINVTGCSDNSLFTNYGFLQTYADNYRYFAMEGSAVCYYDKKQVLSMQQFEHKRKEEDRARKRKQSELEMAALANGGPSMDSLKSGSTANNSSNRRDSQANQQKEKELAAKKAKKEPKIQQLTTQILLSQTEPGANAGIDIEEVSERALRKTRIRATTKLILLSILGLARLPPDPLKMRLASPRLASAQSPYALTPDEVESLKFWLNSNVMLNPLTSFPGDFVETNGKAGLDAIEFMCGKKIPGKIKKLTSVKKDQLNQLLGQYKELLTFMKTNGGERAKRASLDEDENTGDEFPRNGYRHNGCIHY